MDYLKEVLDSKRIKLLISGGISLIVGLILMFIGIKVTNNLTDQQFAKRWCDDNTYAQVSAFLSEMSGFKDTTAQEVTFKIKKQLTDDSLSAENDDARILVYAYSANGKVTIKSSNGELSVEAIGVGGDYFLFHPLELVSGSYFDEDDLMKDRVVIDTETAWNLFGSNDVAGQVIEIGGISHVICGVVKKDDSKLSVLAGNDKSTIYLSYESLSKNGSASYINTYEALMPNPLTNYARSVLEKNISVDDSRVEVIENSGRFNWVKLLKNLKNFGTRGMNPKGVIYPYWENMARGMEDYLAPVNLLAVVLFLYPCGLVLYILRRMWITRRIHFADIKDFCERKAEEYRERKRKIKKGEIYDEV